MAEQRFYVSSVSQLWEETNNTVTDMFFPRYPEFPKQGPRGPLSMPCLLRQTSLLVIRNSFGICIKDAYLYDCSAVIFNNLSVSKCTTNVPFYP